MEFNLKTYKHFKIRSSFKTINFLFFFQGASLDNKNWIKVEQSLFIHKLKYFTILNKLMITTLNDSIFKNIISIINGPILMIQKNNSNVKINFKELLNVSSWIRLLGFKLNNKIYSKNQVQNLTKISYLENFHSFHNSMKTFGKMPYYTFKNRKVSSVSK